MDSHKEPIVGNIYYIRQLEILGNVSESNRRIRHVSMTRNPIGSDVGFEELGTSTHRHFKRLLIMLKDSVPNIIFNRLNNIRNEILIKESIKVEHAHQIKLYNPRLSQYRKYNYAGDHVGNYIYD